MDEKKSEKESKYYLLMQELKEKILSGTIKPGQKLPSENELAQQYHISRHTVRKALSILENEQYIYAEHGRGTFCTELARHLHPSKNIAVVMTYLSDYIFPRIIEGIDSVLAAEDYSIIMKHTNNSRKRERECLEDLLSKDIDGIIIEPSKSQIYCKHLDLYEKLDQYGIPYVFIQGNYHQMQNKPQVLLDDCAGARRITDYLISLGHRDIYGVFKADDIQGQQRHKGYVLALQQAGIPYRPEKVIWFYTEDRKIHPYYSIQETIRKNGLMDAVVCYNDQIAMEVIRALNQMDLKVPEDVSVTGFDDLMPAESKMKLTTMIHPKEELGRCAAKMLLAIIHKKESNQTSILLEPRLCIGNTSKKKEKKEQKM